MLAVRGVLFAGSLIACAVAIPVAMRGSGAARPADATVAAAPGPAAYTLDGFEQADVRVVQPHTFGNLRYLWNLGLGSGSTEITGAQSHGGTRALHNRFTSGSDWQFQFYTYTESLSGFSTGWQFMRKFVSNPSSWQMGKVNRMRFWVKVPLDTPLAAPGKHNVELGTYIRCSACAGAEDGGGHFYHFYNIPGSGEWHQIIVDTHPNHSRGDNGSAERGDRVHPTNELGFTYFDLLTRFYIDFPTVAFGTPADFYMDDFELYEETRPENTDQIYSLNGVYVPSSHTLYVGWQRRKDQPAVNHEVRYAFSDIHAIGWDHATPAPDGIVSPSGDGAYNSMAWLTHGLDLAGRSTIYVAIKPQNSPLMREIAIPLASDGRTDGTPARGVR